MKTTYKNFRLVQLRPARYNHEEMILDIEIDKVFLHKVNLNEARALDLSIGDTVYCFAGVAFEDEKKDYIKIHMSGEIIDDFINRFGIDGANVKFTGKFEHVFAIFAEYDDKEINTYKLLEILG